MNHKSLRLARKKPLSFLAFHAGFDMKRISTDMLPMRLVSDNNTGFTRPVSRDELRKQYEELLQPEKSNTNKK